MDIETIRAQLKSLKLGIAATELDTVLNNQKKAVSLGWLADLLEREIDARKENALNSRIKKAKFPEATTIEGFDFAFNPEIDELNFLKKTDSTKGNFLWYNYNKKSPE